jgi:hypothetical protein
MPEIPRQQIAGTVSIREIQTDHALKEGGAHFRAFTAILHDHRDGNVRLAAFSSSVYPPNQECGLPSDVVAVPVFLPVNTAEMPERCAPYPGVLAIGNAFHGFLYNFQILRETGNLPVSSFWKV